MRNIIALMLLALLAAGCATAPDDESEIPWNQPQAWEGSPALPGMGGYGQQ